MRKHFPLKLSIKAFLLLSLFSIISCIPQKKLRYLQQVESSITDSTILTKKITSAYRIQSKDELYIKVNSLDPKTYVFFNGGETTNNNSNNNDVSLYLNSYTVNDSGIIELPVVGKVKLLGLTIKEASTRLEDSLKKYLTEVSVTVKLSGFNITLLGEVKRPGRYISYVSQMNVLEALALGGDMTAYGNREKVFLVREEKGKEHVYFLNLLDRNIINNDNFNLLPNDIIYVEPLNSKTWGFESFPYSIILSSLTTFIALTALILQLKK